MLQARTTAEQRKDGQPGLRVEPQSSALPAARQHHWLPSIVQVQHQTQHGWSSGWRPCLHHVPASHHESSSMFFWTLCLVYGHLTSNSKQEVDIDGTSIQSLRVEMFTQFPCFQAHRHLHVGHLSAEFPMLTPSLPHPVHFVDRKVHTRACKGRQCFAYKYNKRTCLSFLMMLCVGCLGGAVLYVCREYHINLG